MKILPKPMHVALTALLCALACHSVSAQPVDCVQITDARERLTCYDEQFSRNIPETNSSANTNISSGATNSKTSVATSYYRSEPSAPSSAPPTTSVPAPQGQDDAPPLFKGLFQSRDKVAISSKIAAVRSEYPKKMVFRLDNGQIWMQNSPRDLAISEGDEATIKSGRIGGYILHTDNGVSTRVKRIK